MFLVAKLIAFAFVGVAVAHPQINPTQKRRVDQVVSVFENETLELQYQYIEHLEDGRGYTAGRAGFTTATGDLLDVVEKYLKRVKNQEWKELLPTIVERAKLHSDSIVGLEALPQLWIKTALDSRFRKAQDDVVEEQYENPAKHWARRLGLRTALGYLCIYDTAIQHGLGEDDPDGLPAIANRVISEPNNEEDFLMKFLAIRYQVLMHPSDPQTEREWQESVGRVIELTRLVHEGNFNLNGPFTINPFGKQFMIR